MAHWKDQDFLEVLYGLKAEDRHLAECQECACKLAHYRARRQTVLTQTAPVLSPDFLAAQRRSIYERIQSRQSGIALRIVRPALALLSLCALAFLLSLPPGHGPARLAEPEDEALYSAVYYEIGGNGSEVELYSDIYRMVSDSGLRAAAPIQELFEN
jgi:hypothetical protein